MRRRLLISTLAVAVTAVVLFGLPLAFVMSRLQVTAAQEQVQRDATTVARTLQNRVRSGLPADIEDATEAARSLPDRYVSISREGARPVTFGKPEPRDAAIVAHAVAGDFHVTVESDKKVVRAGVTEGLGLIGALARVAEGLDGSAQRISELLAAEREFASDASHQLRSPLTALSMRLEEMVAAAGQPEVVREEGAAALHQTERLAKVVSELLGRSRRPVGSSPDRVFIDDAVAQQVVEWDPAFRRVHRKLEVVGERNLTACASAGALSQVIATLLDNALVHGGGTVTIRTSQTAKSVLIEVRDEGEGVSPGLVPRIFDRNVSGTPGGTGLGLALARSIAAADGGTVVLVRPQPAVFGVFLPRDRNGKEDVPVVSGPA